MISLASEALLMLGVFGLYLLDAAMLLYADEVVLTRGRKGWSASIGAGYMLGGRFPCLPAPFAPWRATFRESWDATLQPDATAPAEAFWRALLPVQCASAVLSGLLFVVLPSALFLHATHMQLLILIATVYCTSATCIAYTIRRRHILGLSGRAVAALAFDVLACPPFAVNIARKISLARGLGADPRAFVCRVVPSSNAARLLARADERRHGCPGSEPSTEATSIAGPHS